MLCSECGKNEATVHYTHIINGKKTEKHLCEQCAKLDHSLFNSNFSMENLFSSMLNNAFSSNTYFPTSLNSSNVIPHFEQPFLGK
jgi:protein arginine kinase activator